MTRAHKIEVFRRGALVSLDDIVTAGTGWPRACPWSRKCCSGSVFDSAVDLYRRARRAGFTVRSSGDCLIAACALRHGLTVVHCDRHYPNLAPIARLNQTNIRPIVEAKRRK